MCTPSIPVRSPFLSHLLRLVCGSSPLTSLARSPRFRTSRSYLACNSFIWFIIICRSSVSAVSTTSILSRRIVGRAQRSSERVCESRFWTLDTSSRQHQRFMEKGFCGVRSIIFSPVHARKPLGCSRSFHSLGDLENKRFVPRCAHQEGREAMSAMPACLLFSPLLHVSCYVSRRTTDLTSADVPEIVTATSITFPPSLQVPKTRPPIFPLFLLPFLPSFLPPFLPFLTFGLRHTRYVRNSAKVSG